jgi:hypothetical protein
VLDKRVKRKIFGSRMDEVIGKWIKLHKEEMYYVYHHQRVLWRLDQGGLNGWQELHALGKRNVRREFHLEPLH